MKIKIGVMGPSAEPDSPRMAELARSLGEAIAARDLILLTGATTGAVHLTGQTARDAGALHLGISPAANETEHVERFNLPIDACDALIYTGFGLKGRNVVLVRSCDIVIIFAGSIGGLNEFTIAYDEGKVIGCLKGSGDAADEIERLVELLKKKTRSRIVYDDDPERLIDRCVKICGAGQ
ncbi:MAG TPA: hypothetical protein VNG71_10415 [Pyrinomonadaceae bacterium]|nr:hypothetical protein [Pyrinomonadaceae bacterium]